ncbi:pyridoxamine 5'-phosphate oxidase family protein [Nocardiopsis lucentensis]|uniref:pyridoxamine 5'-phosphate oxidase family protein n=1 Tax=Nocardiopsis lucentensis TaxID=53441 RepID=UPI00034DE07B|nr:pyridoxamine 5'-phosphate oxidase family protein [Nocardiopsis lucentensis]
MASQTPRAEGLTGGPPGSWAEVLPLLESHTGTYWLSGPHSGHRPHTRPVLAVWVSGQPWFASGEGTAKTGLLSAAPDVSLAFQAGGMDLVVEGSAQRILDRARTDRVARAYAERYGWAPQAGDGVLTGAEGAPTAGPPPYAVYTIVPTTVYAFPSDDAPHGPTRWRFDA